MMKPTGNTLGTPKITLKLHQSDLHIQIQYLTTYLKCLKEFTESGKVQKWLRTILAPRSVLSGLCRSSLCFSPQVKCPTISNISGEVYWTNDQCFPESWSTTGDAKKCHTRIGSFHAMHSPTYSYRRNQKNMNHYIRTDSDLFSRIWKMHADIHSTSIFIACKL